MVLANGSSVTANATSHPDLFWAMRGAGHQNYGVATALTYKAFPIPPRVPSCNVTFDVGPGGDLDAAAQALKLWRDSYVDAPGKEHLVIWPFLSATMGQPASRQMAFLAVLWRGGEAELQEMMAPLAALGASAAGAVVPNPEGVLSLEVRARGCRGQGGRRGCRPRQLLCRAAHRACPCSHTRLPTGSLALSLIPAQDPLMTAINGLGPDPSFWESKRGQYVTRALSVAEWRSVLDGVFSFPKFPAGYSGQAYMAGYLEPYEGARSACPPPACSGCPPTATPQHRCTPHRPQPPSTLHPPPHPSSTCTPCRRDGERALRPQRLCASRPRLRPCPRRDLHQPAGCPGRGAGLAGGPVRPPLAAPDERPGL